MKIGILCAGDEELAPFLPLISNCKITEKAMLKFHAGQIDSVEVVALFSGVCKVNAAIAAQLLIDVFCVDIIINSGTAGGMEPELEIFDTVTLAIFEPTGNGDYKFSTSTNRNSDEIIVGGVAINGEWYDLIWFNGAKTEYAEITYTINGQVQDTLRYNTDDMDIISIKNPEKEYSIHVAYYDNDGNKYE